MGIHKVNELTFIIGGCRSGKSRHALQIAEETAAARSFNAVQAYSSITPATEEERESMYINLLDFEESVGTEE